MHELIVLHYQFKWCGDEIGMNRRRKKLNAAFFQQVSNQIHCSFISRLHSVCVFFDSFNGILCYVLAAFSLFRGYFKCFLCMKTERERHESVTMTMRFACSVRAFTVQTRQKKTIEIHRNANFNKQ